MRTTELAIRTERRAGAEILRVQGELDLTNTETLRSALDQTRAGTIVLDLGMVTFVDSAGIRAIDRAHGSLREAGRSLVVVAPPESRAAWTFRVAGFGADTVQPSVEDALVGHTDE